MATVTAGLTCPPLKCPTIYGMQRYIYLWVDSKKKTYRYSHENGQAKSQSLEGTILHLSAGTAGKKVKNKISQEFSN